LRRWQRHGDDGAAGAHVAMFVDEASDFRLDRLGGMESSWHRVGNGVGRGAAFEERVALVDWRSIRHQGAIESQRMLAEGASAQNVDFMRLAKGRAEFTRKRGQDSVALASRELP
jgi:hypothetical protein